MGLLPGRIIIPLVLNIGLFVCHITSQTLRDAYNISVRYDLWMAEYGRVYQTKAEKEMRLVVFKNNVEFIEALNSHGNRSYTLAINQFADQTKDEFKANFYGLKVPSDMKLPISTSFKYGSLSQAPLSIDWRREGAVTEVKNQFGCQACWAFSAIAAVEGINKIKTGKLLSLSEQQLVDCDRPGSGGCLGGYMESAFDYIAKTGINTENYYPYTASDGTCNKAKERVRAASDTGFERVPPNNETALMMAVSKQPVSVCIDVSCFHFASYSNGVFTQHCGTNLTHGVTVVGYGIHNGLKYWLVKNSWGPGWGYRGFVKLQRDVNFPEGLCGIAMRASYPTS